MTLTTINLAALGDTINLGTEVTGTLPTGNGGTGSTATTFVNAATNVTGTLPIANGGTALTSGFKNAGTYSLHAVADYTETDGYTTTASSTQFTCSDQSCNLTSSATSDVFLIHASLNGYSDADSNGYGLYMVHSSTSDFFFWNRNNFTNGKIRTRTNESSLQKYNWSCYTNRSCCWYLVFQIICNDTKTILWYYFT